MSSPSSNIAINPAPQGPVNPTPAPGAPARLSATYTNGVLTNEVDANPSAVAKGEPTSTAYGGTPLSALPGNSPAANATKGITPVAPGANPANVPVQPNIANTKWIGSDGKVYTMGSGGPTAAAPENEVDFLKAATDSVRGEIDSINTAASAALAAQAPVNENDEGRARATAARTGQLGSPSGNAEISNAETAANQKNEDIRDKYRTQLATVVDKANTQGLQDYNASIKAQQTGSVDAQKLADTAAKNSQANLKTYAQSGGAFASLSADELNLYAHNLGWSHDEIERYIALNSPKDIVKSERAVGNQYVITTEDPITGKINTSLIPLPANTTGFTIERLKDGSIIGIPKNPDPTKPMQDQIVYYTGPNQAGGTTKTLSNGTKISSDTLSQISTNLQNGGSFKGVTYNARGDDGYVDPGMYKSMYTAWVGAGHPTKDFVSLFPPADYVNPAANSQLPTYLQNKGKSGGAASAADFFGGLGSK